LQGVFVAFVHDFPIFTDKVNFLNPLFSAIESISSDSGPIQPRFRGVKISFCHFAPHAQKRPPKLTKRQNQYVQDKRIFSRCEIPINRLSKREMTTRVIAKAKPGAIQKGARWIASLRSQ
jgi:hypothetical protein